MQVSPIEQHHCSITQSRKSMQETGVSVKERRKDCWEEERGEYWCQAWTSDLLLHRLHHDEEVSLVNCGV